MNRIVAGLFLVLCSFLTGCATTGVFSGTNPAKNFVKATANNPAVKCLCVWQTAEGFDPEGKPCRGVAGQVFFFNRDNAVPVVVDGDVHLYVFDDQGSEAEQTKPLTQFDIDRHTWRSQLIATQFGPAYRVFVPYTRPGRQQAQLAVRLKMSPDNGPVVFSDLSNIELAGYQPEKPGKADESSTTAKLEQAVRERLAEDSQSTSQTIATVRSVARTDD